MIARTKRTIRRTKGIAEQQGRDLLPLISPRKTMNQQSPTPEEEPKPTAGDSKIGSGIPEYDPPEEQPQQQAADDPEKVSGFNSEESEEIDPIVAAVTPKKMSTGPNWDALYRKGTPPWDVGRCSHELEQILKEGNLPIRTALELGCGTGANAVLLAKYKLDVTAVEISPIAMERAHVRRQREDVAIRFVLDDAFRFCPTAGTFDFVLDSCFYNVVRQYDLEQLLDLFWRVTHPGSYVFTLAGRPPEPHEYSDENGPPVVTEDEIYDELGRLFDIEQLDKIMLGSPRRAEGYPGWACLMHRPVLDTPE